MIWFHRVRAVQAAAVVTCATVVAAGLVTAVQADTSATVTIRQGDLIGALGDTRAAGHVTFLGDGIGVVTDDNSGQAKAAEYFPVSGELPASGSMEWFGTQPQPGVQIVFDADGTDGNGNDYNLLVGEPVYGDNWWLTSGSSQAAKDADPSGEQDGGNGSEWFGTLEEWKAALPQARIHAGGFSLGSGVKGSGVIRGITYDDTTYRFTDAAAPAPTTEPTEAAVSGWFAVTRKATRRAQLVRLDLVSSRQPAGSVPGARLRWKVTVNGFAAFATSQQFGDRDVWVGRFRKGTGKHVVKVFKNGAQVRTVVVRTGR